MSSHSLLLSRVLYTHARPFTQMTVRWEGTESDTMIREIASRAKAQGGD